MQWRRSRTRQSGVAVSHRRVVLGERERDESRDSPAPARQPIPAPKEDRLSVQSWRRMRSTTGADGDANSDLVLARDGARQHQAAEIGAGYGENKQREYGDHRGDADTSLAA